MHIPDGMVDPVALTVAGIASAGAVAWSAAALRRGRVRAGTALAAGGAVMVAHLLDVPVGGGHTVHLVGAALLSLTVGPWLGVLTMTGVLALEALVLGDGGVAALGVNVLVMAVVGVLVASLVNTVALEVAAPRAAGHAPRVRERAGAAALAAGASVGASSVVLMAMGGAAWSQLALYGIWAAAEAAAIGAAVALGLAWRRRRALVLDARRWAVRRVHVLDGDMEALR